MGLVYLPHDASVHNPVRYHLRYSLPSPKTNSSHLKMDVWNTSFFFGMAYFQGFPLAVRFRVCISGDP